MDVNFWFTGSGFMKCSYHQHVTNKTRTLAKDLLILSRLHKYNPILATFAGESPLPLTKSTCFPVWSTLLTGSKKLKEDPSAIDISTVLLTTLLCFLYTYILCGAGMVWNDWVDRDIDANVARTRNRPLASGSVTTAAALFWMGLHMSYITPTTLGIILYSFAKRPLEKQLYVYPQFILSVTCALPSSSGWAAVYGPGITMGTPFQIGALVAVWIVYLNTAYSCQDIEGDKRLGVNSLYLLLSDGNRTRVELLLASTRDPASGGTVHKKNLLLGVWTVFALVVEVGCFSQSSG
ncbi:UbiA prenyltransferase family-domain-containing protein [Aspergillus venezuelensis]